MEQAILQRSKTDEYETCTSLVLDGCRIRQIQPTETALLAKFSNLQTLSANQTYLTSLNNLPPLPHLKTLELQDNLLGGDSSLEALALSPNISCLLLGGNKIKTLASLTPLNGLRNLKMLDLELCPIAAEKGYRAAVFAMLPQLAVIDREDREGREVKDEDSEEDEESEEDEDEETLKAFYEKDYDGDDDEDGEDFQPEGDAEDEEFDSEEEDTTLGDSGARGHPDDAAHIEKKARTGE